MLVWSLARNICISAIICFQWYVHYISVSSTTNLTSLSWPAYCIYSICNYHRFGISISNMNNNYFHSNCSLSNEINSLLLYSFDRNICWLWQIQLNICSCLLKSSLMFMIFHWWSLLMATIAIKDSTAVPIMLKHTANIAFSYYFVCCSF